MSNALRSKRKPVKQKPTLPLAVSSPGNVTFPSAVLASGASMSLAQVSDATGVKVKILTDYLKEKEKEITDALIVESQEKLWKAEDYIAVANIIMAILAVKKTYKTEKRGVLGWKRVAYGMTEHLNWAQEEINRLGIEKIYKQISEETDVQIEFDSMDLNKEFHFNDFDFRQEVKKSMGTKKFDQMTVPEAWDESWETAKDMGTVIDTCSIGLALKRLWGFRNEDIKKLVEETNSIQEEAKNHAHGVTELIEEFEWETGLDVGEANRELFKKYGL